MTGRLTSWLAGAADPVRVAKQLKFEPDPWQRKVLRSTSKYMCLVCSRQVGKSTTTALLALHYALFHPGAVILIFSPTDRQSGELFLKISGFYRALGKPIDAPQETVHMLRLENDARILSLPASESGVRGYTPSLILIDEAGFVPDGLFGAVSPMLAVSGGRLIAMGTPNGQRGFFHEASLSNRWEHVVVPATDCPRISAEFLEAERERLGDVIFAQEYMCSFQASAGSAFRPDDIEAMFEARDRPEAAPRRSRPSLTSREERIAAREMTRIMRHRPRYGDDGATSTCRHGIPLTGRCPRCAAPFARPV